MKTAIQTTQGFDVKEVGTVLEIRKVIARIQGLPSCAYGQPLSFPGGLRGMVVGFDKRDTLALVFGDVAKMKAGDFVHSREESLLCPVGNGFVGRIVNGLAEPCDGKGPIRADNLMPFFAEAPGIMDRVPLARQLHTGVKILDAVIPVAKGQRELILGDRVTGKTTLATDTILNQKGKNVVCIYCSIGRSFNFLMKLTQLFYEHGALDYTVLVGATGDSPVGEQFLTPYTAATLGEHFMREGKDVFVVFDDLSKHAWIYRQISLLLGRAPGREAYPGDIFYIHSQLVERAAQLKPELGGGSMTFFPIVETQQGDVTSYICSNLISMTDGQIYMNAEIFQEGLKPAIDFGLSVSRIGNKIQCPMMKNLSAMLRLEYLQYRELANISKLRSTVSQEAQAKLKHGQTISEVLKQDKNKPVSLLEQIVLLYSLRKGALDALTPAQVQKFCGTFFPFLRKNHLRLLERIQSEPNLLEATKAELDSLVEGYLVTLVSGGQ